MNILFAASEVAPFCKTGGLADVAGALPRALAARGHQVLTVVPLYRVVDRARWELRPTDLSVDGARVWRRSWGPRAELLFLEKPEYFDRPGLYGEHSVDYPDNAWRLAWYARALLPAAAAVSFGPIDVLHLNDWQTGLAAWELARSRGSRPGLARCVFTIHNLGYLGLFDKSLVPQLGLPWDVFTPEAMEFWDQLSFLKAGLAFADQLTTVSPTYAREIQQAGQGAGLEGLLRARADALTGILNGVDMDEWNPRTDSHLAAHYNPEDVSGKAVCRAALCRELGLEDRGGLIAGIVSRFAGQKGIDLVLEALPGLLDRGVQLAVLGSGEVRIEEAFAAAARDHAGRVGFSAGYHNGLAHRIEAGSDVFLMPSVYEPCGLNQMYSMIYGTPPIVRRTGGLADTVEEEGPGRGTGFVIREHTAASLLDAVDRALECRADARRWRELQVRGMTRDFSWDAAAAAYERVYAR